MDADGLPIVGTGIDFSKVGAIHQKRTLAFLNHFISHTVRFLNRFSCVCEEKLETLAIRLQRLETTMSLLEAKLASVPGLENVTAPTTTTPSTPQSSNDSQASAPVETPPVPETNSAAPEQEATNPTAEETPQMTVSQDPRYARFFKMIQVGVPVPAVKIKVAADGLNPDLLDTPNAPAPGGEPSTKDDDGPEFSSDEDGEASSSDDDDSSGFSD